MRNMVNSQVNVVMYHYVRPLSLSRYPDIKGLESQGFYRQVNYFCENFEVLGMRDLLAVIDGSRTCERQAVVLTFDDGFIDHFHNVFPVLHDFGVQGCFYPPSLPVLEKQLLDVHRIHFILAVTQNHEDVLTRLRIHMRDHLGASQAQLLSEGASTDRFDSPETVVIKHLLQRYLPKALRNEICEELFREFVSIDEKAFVEELYMNESQMRLMTANGMHIGSHTDSHEWLGSLDTQGQEHELRRSMEMLEIVGANPDHGWSLAYPSGDYNEITLDLAASLGCQAAFTMKVGPADVSPERRLEISRFDTNDFPQ